MRRAWLLRCPSLPLAVSGAATKLYEQIIDVSAHPSELAATSQNLLPHLNAGALTTLQTYRVLDSLSARAIRHEGVLQKCIWDIFKASSGHPPANTITELSPREYALCVAATFRRMATMGFTNDSQMVALGFGRCIEVTPHLSLAGVAEVYGGLQAFGRDHFSLTEVALHQSNVTSNFTFKEAYESPETATFSSSMLESQPNLVDILCAHLESRLHELASACHIENDGTTVVEVGALAHMAVIPEVSDPSSLRGVLRALASVGVLSAEPVRDVKALLQNLGRLPLEYAVDTLESTIKIQERVVDALDFQPSRDVAAAQADLIVYLSGSLLAVRNPAMVFRHNPLAVLRLRRMFEESPILAENSLALWDQIRCVRVAHHHAARKGGPKNGRSGGKLFDPKYKTKLKPISENLCEAGRFVPPEFKTWRSPQHTPRGGHKPSSRTPRKMAFGTRRITKNYLKKKREKYCH